MEGIREPAAMWTLKVGAGTSTVASGAWCYGPACSYPGLAGCLRSLLKFLGKLHMQLMVKCRRSAGNLHHYSGRLEAYRRDERKTSSSKRQMQVCLSL